MRETISKTEPRKGFVWYSLRISFWVMIAFLLFEFIVPPLVVYGSITLLNLHLIINEILPIGTIFLFIISIIHLFKYKKKTFVIVALIIPSLIIAYYVYILTSDIYEQCSIHTNQIGEFDQKINSETDAKQITIDYYSSIGYNFSLEDLIAEKINKLNHSGWSITFNSTKIDYENCMTKADSPECINQKLLLEETQSGNKISTYVIAC